MEFKIGMVFKATGEMVRTFKIIGIDDLEKTVYMKRDPGDMTVKLKQVQLAHLVHTGQFESLHRNLNPKEV